MVGGFEQASLEELEVGKVSRGAIDDGTGAQRHQGADQDLGLLLLQLMLDVGRIGFSRLGLVLLVTEGLEQLPQIELGETLNGDTKGQKAQASTDPSQEGTLRSKVVSGGGARVGVDGSGKSLPRESRQHVGSTLAVRVVEVGCGNGLVVVIVWCSGV